MEELIKKYRHEKLRFKSYYKYSFIYSSDKIRVVTNGISDDIYRAWLEPVMTLKKLLEEVGDEIEIAEIEAQSDIPRAGDDMKKNTLGQLQHEHNQTCNYGRNCPIQI